MCPTTGINHHRPRQTGKEPKTTSNDDGYYKAPTQRSNAIRHLG